DPWHDAWVDLYNKTHTEHVIMTEALRDAAEFGNENPFQAKRAAMSLTHLWYQCCASPADDDGNPIDPDWDIAAVPSYNGTTTANFNADTFRIWGETEHPQEAFEVLTYLLGEASQDLLGIYGGMPARIADQDAFFAGLDEHWPQGVDWQVAIDGVEFADNPNFEAWMPNYQESFDSLVSFISVLRTDPDIDVEAEIADFMDGLQVIFDRAEE
ncbi:MAG TPA: sugar ABC transporter substrate-binding protein, partial [Candidatus Limnocylindria bacterium]